MELLFRRKYRTQSYGIKEARANLNVDLAFLFVPHKHVLWAKILRLTLNYS